MKSRLLWGFAAAYLLTSLGYLGMSFLGLSPTGPAAYCFTWDMFPHFQSESRRRVAIGRTRNGRYILLHPSDHQQFRQGVDADLTRADLERSGRCFQSIVESVRLRTRSQRRSDPLVAVLLFEQSWPVKYNLPDRDYMRWMGEPKPNDAGFSQAAEPSIADPPAGIPRAAWRLRLEYSVDESHDESPDGLRSSSEETGR